VKSEQIDKALIKRFITENERLVFWHDAKGEFADYVRAGLAEDLADVKVLEVAAVGGLSAKLLLEREDPIGKYLVYSQGEPPLAEEDWLLDIRLYSAEFHADMASIWLQDLALNTLSLREHLRARAAFLGNQDRRKKVARLISAADNEASLDLKMMAVLTGSQMASAFDVLRAVCHGHLHDGTFELSTPPEIIAIFEKMNLLDRFWEMMQREFSYAADEPSVAGLLRRLFVSELLYQLDGARLDSLAHHLLPATGRRNAVVFLTQWRDSSTYSASYDAASAAIAVEQRIDEALASLDLEAVRGVYTFWESEKHVVSGLKERVLIVAPQSVDVEFVTDLASERKAGHWLSGAGSDSPDRRAVAEAYDAIVAAAKLFALHTQHRQTLRFEFAGELLAAYQKDLHCFDRLYRRFSTASKLSLGQGWDLLKTLSNEVDRVYDQGFLQPLGIEWSRLLDAGFLDWWALDDLPAQRDFYARNIRPHLAESERKRAFVIISDAFRYEAAKELTESLNGIYRMDARLSALLGVLPSYTALGMASLLPHETLAYSDAGEVLVDGNAVAGTEARTRQLATVHGMACQAKDLRKMKLDEARGFTQGKRVVYIYHNIIDDRLDGDARETGSFDTVDECISEIVKLIQFCVNKLNASKVWVTADHGFLFQQGMPDTTDKSTLSHKPEGAVKLNKRYVIGRNLGEIPEAHHGSIEVTAGATGGMEFWVPRGANLFHFAGGARFVHGGAMPQEVVVPLVTVTQLRGKHKEGSRSEKVSVQVLGTNHKITTPKYRFELIQTEAVSERRKPITLRLAVYDGTQAVTSIETVTFDSTSDGIGERKKSVTLELRTGIYDKTKPYRLVLRDIESDAEVQSVSVVIDRSFDDDF